MKATHLAAVLASAVVVVAATSTTRAEDSKNGSSRYSWGSWYSPTRTSTPTRILTPVVNPTVSPA